MKVYCYSPSVEAYVASMGKDGKEVFYDVSRDIASCNVTRKDCETASFSIELNNEGGKYNGVFLPMDRVTIFATKASARNQLITGYINSVTRFTLYPQGFKITGTCSLYRLQKLYWDPHLASSNALMTEGGASYGEGWDDFSSAIYRLVNVIGGINNIYIGDMPQKVIDWARKLYEAKSSDINQMSQHVDAFRKMLSESTSSVGVSGDSVAMRDTGGYAGNADVEQMCKWAVATADDQKVGYSQVHRQMNPDVDCSSFVWFALLNSGWTKKQLGGYPFATGGMTGILEGCGWVKSRWNGSESQLKRGDIMWVHNLFHQHTEIYIGDGKTVGAHSDENGGIKGVNVGDQGDEVSITGLSSSFTHFFRFSGGDKK